MSMARFHRLVLAAIVALLAAVPVGAAYAEPPEVQIISIDDTFPALTPSGDPICSFPVTQHEEGAIRVMSHLDRSGNPSFVMEIRKISGGFTNLATGKSLPFHDASLVRTTFAPDGSSDTAFIGLIFRVVVPGAGVILSDVGNINFDFNPDGSLDISFEAGPHQLLHGDTQALCAALAN
jgi:hypothetical protein